MRINNIKVPKALEQAVQTLFVAGKVHPNYYRGKGRNASCSADLAKRLYQFLQDALKLKTHHLTLGNDAPRGGHTGCFVELTPAGRRLKVVRESVSEFRRLAEQERAAKAEAMRIRHEKVILRERRYNEVGGDEAAMSWFKQLPEERRETFRGYTSGVVRPPYSKSLCKRIREAFKKQLL